MLILRALFGVAVIACASLAFWWAAQPMLRPTSHRAVVIIAIDGLRWQEFFTGADRDLLRGGEPESRFWRETREERQLALMPFVWTTVRNKGQIFGDPAAGSSSRVTNEFVFSYPGYNEMLSGRPDPRVNTNTKVANPNVTVLEWLNRRRRLKGGVAAFAAWDVWPWILNVERSGLVVGSGWSPVPKPEDEREHQINQLAADLPRAWAYGPFDAPVVYAALEHLRTKKPRVLLIVLSEADEWAHRGRYDLYLDATYRADRFIRRVWDTVQVLPGYANRTTLLITTDHGRGGTVQDWTTHGKDVPFSDRTWIAAIGAGVPHVGVHQNVNVTTGQIAATIAQLVGEDFRAAAPEAAPPLPLSVR